MAVDISVAGDNLGAIVVGDHNTVVINQPAGAVVLPAQPVQTTRRKDGAMLGPRPFPDLVDRREESGGLRGALAAVPPQSIDVSGPPGIGKTAILRYVCGDEAIRTSFADGVVYLDAASASTGDLLQELFEAFFETDRPFKPDETQVRRFLARTSALVLLDGYLAPAAQFDRLLNLAATATFAVSGPQRVLLGEGSAVTLGGLQSHDALELMARELQHPIDESEVMAARAICAALDGNPLDIILAAAHVRVYGVQLGELADGVRGAESSQEWLKGLIAGKLSDRDRAALAAFAAVGCAPLETSEVGAIAGTEAAAALGGLQDRRLVGFDGKRSRVRGGIAAALAMSFLGLLPAEAAAQAFLQIAAHSQSDVLVAHSDAIAGAMKHAVLSGKFAHVAALAHRAGDAVALSGRWGRWDEMLGHALSAAKGGHDVAGEAWALHQIGSSALAIGNFVAARSALEAAAHIRASLGDPNALAVTQHNLNVLALNSGLPEEPSHIEAAASKWGLVGKIAVGAAIVAALGAVGMIGAWVSAHPSVSLKAAHSRIARGESTKLCYHASSVTNVRINGSAAAHGCVVVHPDHTTTYRIDARGPLGIPLTQSVVVKVAAAAPASGSTQASSVATESTPPSTTRSMSPVTTPTRPPANETPSSAPYIPGSSVPYTPRSSIPYVPRSAAPSSAPTSAPTRLGNCNYEYVATKSKCGSGSNGSQAGSQGQTSGSQGSTSGSQGSTSGSQGSQSGVANGGCRPKTTGVAYIVVRSTPRPSCTSSATSPGQTMKQGGSSIYRGSYPVSTQKTHYPVTDIPGAFNSPSSYSHATTPYSRATTPYSPQRPLYSEPRSTYPQPHSVYTRPLPSATPVRRPRNQSANPPNR